MIYIYISSYKEHKPQFLDLYPGIPTQFALRPTRSQGLISLVPLSVHDLPCVALILDAGAPRSRWGWFVMRQILWSMVDVYHS